MRSVLKFSAGRVRITDYLEASATDVLHAVRQQGLEGIIGKRKDSIYEIGERSGSWIKFRVNRGQELVIGGYIPGAHRPGLHRCRLLPRSDLIYVARVCNGFVPASRRQVFGKLKQFEVPDSFRESAGETSFTLGRRPDGRGYEEMHLAAT
jgi:ATP-dependent DNA ligase